jgi:CheY-specific phosphatase CheX
VKADFLEHLSAAALDVLKTSAFAWGEPCATSELPTAVGDAVLTQIRFDGDCRGDVSLALSRGLAMTLAADVLAAEPDELSDDQVIDACKELTNVLCGQWLTRSFGTQPVFHLSVPEAISPDERSWTTLIAAPGAVGMLIDDQPLAACLNLQPESMP